MGDAINNKNQPEWETVCMRKTNAKNPLDCTSSCNLCYCRVILSHTKVSSSSSPLPVQFRNANLLVQI